MTKKWDKLKVDPEDEFFIEYNTITKPLREGAKKFAEVLKKAPPREPRMAALIVALDGVYSAEIRELEVAISKVNEALGKFSNKTPTQTPFGRHISRKLSAEMAIAMGEYVDKCVQFYTKNTEILKMLDPSVEEIEIDVDQLNLD